MKSFSIAFHFLPTNYATHCRQRFLDRQRDQTRLGQPDGISPSRMAEMLEVDKAGPKVRC
jgi:hypothetical protein